MRNEWKPEQRDIEITVSLLKSKLPQAQAVVDKRPDVKDLYAALDLADALYFCLKVLPPDVAALARQHYDLIQCAYHSDEASPVDAPH